MIDSGFWTEKTGLKFSCPHLEKLSGTVSAMEEYNLTAELVSDYPGGIDIKRQLMAAVEHAKQQVVPLLKKGGHFKLLSENNFTSTLVALYALPTFQDKAVHVFNC